MNKIQSNIQNLDKKFAQSIGPNTKLPDTQEYYKQNYLEWSNIEKFLKLNYLDLTLKINNYGNISSETFYKPTDSFAYLHPESNHPKHCSENIALSQSIRHIRNCSNFSSFIFHTRFLKFNLLRKTYNYNQISRKMSGIHFRNRKTFLSYRKRKRLTRTPLIVTYNKTMPNINSIVKRQTDDILDSDNFKAIGGYPIIGSRILKSIGAKIIRAIF